METKKAYGVVTALGTDLGHRAKSDKDVLAHIRGLETREAFTGRLDELFADTKLATLATQLAEHTTGEDWKLWRSRLLLQAKMVRDGEKPAPGHEAGKGNQPGRP